jgi:hypothetical protein
MRFEQLGFSPELVQARWQLGKLPSEDVPRLAQDALELGFDGSYTRRIAGLIHPNYFDLEPLMSKFLLELGIQNAISHQQAGGLLARCIAAGIAEGRTPQYEGARYIWWEIVNDLWPNPPEELLVFVGHASEYEDCQFYASHPDEVRHKIEEDIIADARGLLASGG